MAFRFFSAMRSGDWGAQSFMCVCVCACALIYSVDHPWLNFDALTFPQDSSSSGLRTPGGKQVAVPVWPGSARLILSNCPPPPHIASVHLADACCLRSCVVDVDRCCGPS